MIVTCRLSLPGINVAAPNGTMTSALRPTSKPEKPCGMTPTTVKDTPSSVRERPMTSGTAPYCRCQKAWLMTATGPSTPPFRRSSDSVSSLPNSGEMPRVWKYDPLTQAPETICASPRGTRLKSVDDQAKVPSKTSTNRRNDSHTPSAYALTPGTVASVTRTSAFGSLTGNLRSSRLLVTEKITMLAPIPRVSDRAATP